jgi:hypothetical protein
VGPTRRGVTLDRCDFTNAHLEGSDLEGCILKGCKFASAVMDAKTNLTNVTGLPALVIRERSAQSLNRRAVAMSLIKSTVKGGFAQISADSGDDDDGGDSGSDASGEDDGEEQEHGTPWQKRVEKELDKFMEHFFIVAQFVASVTDKSLEVVGTFVQKERTRVETNLNTELLETVRKAGHPTSRIHEKAVQKVIEREVLQLIENIFEVALPKVCNVILEEMENTVSDLVSLADKKGQKTLEAVIQEVTDKMQVLFEATATAHIKVHAKLASKSAATITTGVIEKIMQQFKQVFNPEHPSVLQLRIVITEQALTLSKKAATTITREINDISASACCDLEVGPLNLESGLAHLRELFECVEKALFEVGLQHQVKGLLGDSANGLVSGISDSSRRLLKVAKLYEAKLAKKLAGLSETKMFTRFVGKGKMSAGAKRKVLMAVTRCAPSPSPPTVSHTQGGSLGGGAGSARGRGVGQIH